MKGKAIKRGAQIGLETDDSLGWIDEHIAPMRDRKEERKFKRNNNKKEKEEVVLKRRQAKPKKFNTSSTFYGVGQWFASLTICFKVWLHD